MIFLDAHERGHHLTDTDKMSILYKMKKRMDFELYKSHICHKIKYLGDLDFIMEILQTNEIRTLYKKKLYPECLYLLAMLDYLSRENELPVCTDYDDMRNMKMKEILYPHGIKIACMLSHSEEPKIKSLQEAIPEFIRHNIVESEIRNVC